MTASFADGKRIRASAWMLDGESAAADSAEAAEAAARASSAAGAGAAAAVAAETAEAVGVAFRCRRPEGAARSADSGADASAPPPHEACVAQQLLHTERAILEIAPKRT
jgi:hypothetical protein